MACKVHDCDLMVPKVAFTEVHRTFHMDAIIFSTITIK